MRMLTLSVAAALVLAGGGHAQSAGMTINPGKWEYTTNMAMQMNMNGQAMDIPAQTETVEECVTPENATFSPDDVSREGCTVSNLQQTGTTMSFSMTCNSDGMMMNGDVSLSTGNGGDTSEALISLNGEQPGMGTIAINATMSGRRVGACEG